MASLNRLSLFMLAVLTFFATGEGFFLYSSKKSSQERGGAPPQYYRDTSPAGPMNWGPQPYQQYTFDGSGPVTVALPVAVPIQAQMAPMPPAMQGTVHNVQLVPCLCPVSKDFDPNSVMQPQPQTPSASYGVQNSPQQGQTQT